MLLFGVWCVRVQCNLDKCAGVCVRCVRVCWCVLCVLVSVLVCVVWHHTLNNFAADKLNTYAPNFHHESSPLSKNTNMGHASNLIFPAPMSSPQAHACQTLNKYRHTHTPRTHIDTHTVHTPRKHRHTTHEHATHVHNTLPHTTLPSKMGQH